MGERSREQESSLRGYEHEFLRAAEALSKGAEGVFVSNAQKIKLYALYKQGTLGDCNKPQPGAFQPVERAKWNGWQELHGMNMTVAKRRYVLEVMEILPTFMMPTETESSELPSLAREEPEADRSDCPPPSTINADFPQLPRTQRQPTAVATVVPNRFPDQRKSVPILSYGMIVLEVLAFMAVIAGILRISTQFLLPICDELALEHFEVDHCGDIAKPFMPALWFGLGYVFVWFLRSRMFSWRVLSGEFAKWTLGSRPILARRQRRAKRRTQRRSSNETKDPMAEILERFGITLIKEPTRADDSTLTPRLEIAVPENPDATSFAHGTTEFPFPLEKTAEMFYRKFKEPLPDPANSLLESITPIEEIELEEYSAVFQRRILSFRNDTPYMIKRFVSEDYVEFIEDSLLDKRNRIFYVYFRNKSFQSIGILEEYSVFKAVEDKPDWSCMTQYARVQITSSAIGFFRSSIISLISGGYAKKAPRAREYHRGRMIEEFGAPEDWNEADD